MNINNIKIAPFYPGLITDEDQDRIRGSDLWPIVLSLHFNTGGKIFVTDISEEAGRNRIFMRTSEGALILGIKKDAVGEISIHLSIDILNRVLRKGDLIFSSNSKYITNKLKQGEDIREKILAHIKVTENKIIPDSLQKLINAFSSATKEAGTEVKVEMDNVYQEYALRALFAGDKLGIQPNNVSGLKEWYKKVQESDIKKIKYEKRYAEMFSPAKHIVIYVQPDLYITGVLKTICREKDFKISCMILKDLTMTRDLKTQPELMASLTFWKVLRESRKDKVSTLDKDGMLINNTSWIDYEAGSMVRGEISGSNACAIYLIHKTGEQI